MMGVLDCAVSESNIKNIRRDYKTYVLSIGEYDERVFLGEEANEEIGNVTLVSDDNNTSFVCFQEHQGRCCVRLILSLDSK